MRVDQLSAMAKAHLGERYEFHSLLLFKAGQPRRQRQVLSWLRDAVVIFLKGSGGCFDAEGRARLKAEARGVCIDHVDAVFGLSAVSSLADVHIFSSHAGYRATAPIFARSRGRVEAAFVSHHADPGIMMRDHRAASGVQLAYIGDPSNTIAPEALSARLRSAPGGSVADQARANLHWAIRKPGWRGDPPLPAFKPFTKGINAAWAGANVIVNRDEDDALEYLGAGYPYLAEDASEAAALAAFRYAERTVGGAEWRRGLEQMAKVRARTSPEVIMAELDAILKRFA